MLSEVASMVLAAVVVSAEDGGVVWSADGAGGIVVAAALATPPARVFGVEAVGGGVGDIGKVVVVIPLEAAVGPLVGCAVGEKESEMGLDVGRNVAHSHVWPVAVQLGTQWWVAAHPQAYGGTARRSGVHVPNSV